MSNITSVITDAKISNAQENKKNKRKRQTKNWKLWRQRKRKRTEREMVPSTSAIVNLQDGREYTKPKNK